MLDKEEGLSCVVPNKLSLVSCQYWELRDYFHPYEFIGREEIYFDYPPVSNNLIYWTEKIMKERNRCMALPISNLFSLTVCRNSYILESHLSYGMQLGEKCLSKLSKDSYQFARKKFLIIIGILFLVILVLGGHMRVLITGASSGIGYQVGKVLASHGHLVYMTCRSVFEVFHLREKLKADGVSAICFKLDLLTDDVFLVNHLDIDCLFNHAGIGISGSVLTMDDRALRDVYEVNVFRSFLFLKMVYCHMIERKIPGKIFVTSSLLSMFPLPFFGIYSSSKSAISQLVKTLQKEEMVFRHGIFFCLVEPGAYATGFNQVMIDQQEKFIDSSFKNHFSSIHAYQRKLFLLLESRNVEKLAHRIVYEMERKKTKRVLRIPWIQGLLLKIYQLFFL